MYITLHKDYLNGCLVGRKRCFLIIYFGLYWITYHGSRKKGLDISAWLPFEEKKTSWEIGSQATPVIVYAIKRTPQQRRQQTLPEILWKSSDIYLSGLIVFSEQLIPLNDGLCSLLAGHIPLLPDRLDVLAGLAQLLLGLSFVLHLMAILLQQLIPLADGPVTVHQWRVQLLSQNKRQNRMRASQHSESLMWCENIVGGLMQSDLILASNPFAVFRNILQKEAEPFVCTVWEGV